LIAQLKPKPLSDFRFGKRKTAGRFSFRPAVPLPGARRTASTGGILAVDFVSVESL
jgi:hypothetical protein